MIGDDAIALWDEPLAPEERERLLNAVAEAVARRGLETPAIFALEMHRPFGFLASQGLIVFAPLLAPLLGLERMQSAARLLREPDAVEALLQKIEEASAARKTAAGQRP